MSHVFHVRLLAILSTQLHRSAVNASTCRVALLLCATGRQLCLQMASGSPTLAVPRWEEMDSSAVQQSMW
jgi:hypothetical protein